MKLLVKILAITLFCGFTSLSFAQTESMAPGDICVGYGPQTPRDIDSAMGTNSSVFSLAPDSSEMNLCNIHFHNNAEHKAADFSIFGGEGDYAGYQCNIAQNLPAAQLAAPEGGSVCNGMMPGDTIEVHWVHSSCDVAPGAGLGSCLSDTCANPNLRVETQVFTLVNDSSALDFADFDYVGMRGGYHQANSIPSGTGDPVQFLGSTTGPSYSEQVCSPIQATWSVRPTCATLDINTLGAWCEANDFEEDHAHGVRKLVVNPALLSEIE